jgi:hypothetical protein
MSGWNPLTSPIDYYLLLRRKSPGLSEVAGASQPRKWDERGGYGLSGAFLVYTGDGLAHFSIHTHLFTVDDWDEWNQWKQIVSKPPAGTRPKALDIWHPFLEDLGITSVIVENRMQPVDVGGGEWVHEIKFGQWRMPKTSYAKPESSKVEPLTENEKEIIRLEKVRDDLAP